MVVEVHLDVVVVEAEAESRAVSKAEKLLLLNHIVMVGPNYFTFTLNRMQSLTFAFICLFAEGVFIARGKEDALVSRNLVPGSEVYGEKRISVEVSAYCRSLNCVVFVRFDFPNFKWWFVRRGTETVICDRQTKCILSVCPRRLHSIQFGLEIAQLIKCPYWK